MVAAARLNRAQSRILSARPFALKMETLLQELAYLAHAMKELGISYHPFFEKRESRRVDVVLVTADRGLCGGFNANLIRKTIQYLREHPEDETHLWLVGKKGRDFFRRIGGRIEKEYVNFFHRLGYQQAEILGTDLIDSFLETGTREVIVIYNEFKSRIQQKLTVRTLLPISGVEEVKPGQDFLYEPNRETILEGLMPRHIKAQLYRILLESQAAELAARMTAMDNATRNASDLIYSMTLTMNKVRQANITKEIAEIVGGAEALQTN